MQEAIYLILGLAVFLQAGAALLSWRLIRVTGKQLAWVAISTALILMTIRRSMSFFSYPANAQLALAELSEDLFAFGISLLMFTGIYAIRPVFQGILDSRNRLQEEVRERQKAEQSVRVEQQRFESLTENAPYGLLLVDQDGTFQYLNPKFRELFGYDLKDIPDGREWFRKAYPDPEYRHNVIETWISDLAGSRPGEQRPQILSVQCKDQTTKIIHFRSVQLETGQHIVSCEDITQLKQAEEALVQSEHMLSLILAATPAAITYIDKGLIKWTNPTMLRMFGLDSEDQCLGKKARDFYRDQEEYERVLASFKDRRHACAPVETEARFKRKDGSFFHGELKIKPLNGSSEKRSVISAIMDISEKVRAHQELRESEEKYKNLYEDSQRQYELYRSLLESSADAVVIYDTEGRTKFVNGSFTRIFGWTPEEVLNRRIPYLPDSETEQTMALVGKLIHDGIPVSGFETKRFTKDGHLLDTSISASRYHDHDGQPAGMLVVLSDITQRKLLEEKLCHAAKMEAVGQLAGGLAHDFNNILTAVIGYANLLAKELSDRETCREKLLQITRAAEKASDLTRQLLAFSRKQVLEVAVISLNGIIVDIDRLLKRLIGEHIELTTILDESAGRVQVDPIQIQQILMNLAVNARDAMPQGGNLSIETSNVVLDPAYCQTHPEVEPGPYAMFAVSDSGIGMDHETLSRVFDPFFTTKEKGVGTGLGLATVHGIVKQHHGHITVYSELGRGTTFKVYIPMTKDLPRTRAEIKPQSPRAGGTETVLIVEDEEIVRSLAREALDMLGYHVLDAASPVAAIEICRSYNGPVHLLMTDVVLPKMDGRTLFKTLSPSRPDLKVLYVSGYTENFIVHHGVLDEGVHFMQKPFNLDNLARKIRQILDGG
jgi:two-component system, cell cycle sensor histidine kinase and response regulator CckA